MKIVVKHVDNLKSSLIKGKDPVPQYLIYQMTDDNIPVRCEIANGDDAKRAMIKWMDIQHAVDSQTMVNVSMESLTLPVYEVTYDEFKNNVLRNEATYVRS